METNCDALIHRLNQYLDGTSPPEELYQIRQEAEIHPDCATLLESMIWAHNTFTNAVMAEPPLDFSQSVVQILKRQQRRDNIFLGGVLTVIAVTVLAPIFFLLWTGMIVAFQPGIIHTALSIILSLLNTTATYVAVFLSIISHIPRWSYLTLATLLSVTLLLLALMLAMTKEPYMLLVPNKHIQTL